MARVVVVGAGLAGLATAARLAVRRHDVTLVEQASFPGGQVGREPWSGTVFDTGPALLTVPAVWRDLFARTGDPLERVVPLDPLEPGVAYAWPDGTTVLLPGVGVGATAAAVEAALGRAAAEDWQAHLEHAAQRWQVLRHAVTAPASPLPADPAGRPLAPPAPADPRVAALLGAPTLALGHDPRHAPEDGALQHYLAQTFGLWRVHGGLGTLVDALYQRCLERTVQQRFSTRVVGIEEVTGRVTGVRLADGSVLPADVVVAAAPGVGPAPPAATEPVGGALVVLLVLDDPPELPAPALVSLAADPAAELAAVLAADGPRPAADPTVRLHQVPGAAGATTALRLDVTVPAHRPGEPGGYDWAAPGTAEAYADHVLDVLAGRGTDLRSAADRRVLSPADGAARWGSSDGAIGSSATGPATVPGLVGFHRVGAATHPGATLPLVGLSAEITAGVIGRA